MKKFFLLPFAMLLLAGFGLRAQSCTPDTSLPDTVIVFPLPYQEAFPERGLLDTACVGSFYSTAIHVQIPPTITFGTSEIAIIDVAVTEAGISNLPSSYDYACDPPSCMFTPGEIGCISLYGTAEEGDIGVHDLKINININAGLVLPYSLPDGQLVAGNYYFHVQPEGSDNCTVVGTDDVLENAFGLSIQPNPFSDFTDIEVTVEETGVYQFEVYNAVGALVKGDHIELTAGVNRFTFDGTNLPVGFYVFNLQNGTQAASGRLLIQR